MYQAQLCISVPFQFQYQYRLSSLTQLSMMADTLGVATLGSLNYMLSIHHLSLKLGFDTQDYKALKRLEVWLNLIGH